MQRREISGTDGLDKLARRTEARKHTKSLVCAVLVAAAALLAVVVAAQWFAQSGSFSPAADVDVPFPISAEPVAAENMLPVGEDKGVAAAHAGTPGEDFVEAEAMVVMNEDATAQDTAEFDALLEQYGATAHTVSDAGFGSGGAIKNLVAASEDAISQLIDALSSSNAIVHVQRSYLYHLMDNDSSADTGATGATAFAATSLQIAAPVQTLSAPELSTIKATSVNDPRTVAGEQDGFLNEYYAPEDYPFSGANVAKAWTLSRCAEDAVGDSSVTVAVLDTGCDATHEDLKDNIDTAHMGMLETVQKIENGRMYSDYEVKAGQCRDIFGHGTHVAGIVGASTNNNVGVAGVSYNATVLPISIFYYASRTARQPTSNTTCMVYAFKYLENLITSGELTDLHVINMSLGAYGNQDNDFLLRQAMAKFRDAYRVITICAGGNGNNQGPITDPNYPGDFPEAFSVTWLNAQGRVYWRADYNADKDISAPGTDIMSTMDKTQTLYNTSRQSYGKMSGSSMATPVVSGIAALMWARYPDLTVAQVREAMQKTAHKVADQPAKSGSAGAVDALAALVYAGTNFAGDTFEDIQSPPTPQPKQSLITAQISVSNQVYTGFALMPEPTVTLAGQLLTKDEDYTLEYKNNIDAGSATIAIQGKGNYTGSAETAFEITRAPIDIPRAQSNLTYNGTEQIGVPEGAAYTIAGHKQTNASSYTATATPDSNHCWSDNSSTDARIIPWSIAPKPLTGAMITLNPASYIATGVAINPVIQSVITTDGLKVPSSDYTAECIDNVRPGRATITLTGQNNFTDSAATTFEITAPTQTSPATWGTPGDPHACMWYLKESPITYAGTPTYTLVLVGGDARGATPQKDANGNTLSPWNPWASLISQVEIESTVILPEDSSNLFKGCALIDTMDLSSFDTSHVTTMASMFANCVSLKSIDVSSFNTAAVINMSSMFSACSSLQTLDLSRFNTASVANMMMMFFMCSDLTELNVSSFDTGNVTNMMMMFGSCSSLSSLNLASFSTENLSSSGASYLLNNTTRLEKLTLGTGFRASLDSAKLGTPYVAPDQQGTGLWENQATGQMYAPADIPSGMAATYRAGIKVDISYVQAISDESDFVYTGQRLQPRFTLRDGATQLIENTDYTIEYRDNLDAGQASVVFTAKPESVKYIGSKTVNFTIARAPIDIPRAHSNLTYNGTEQIGVPEGAAYTIVGHRQTNASSYSATATPDSNHCWSDNSSFDARTIPWSIAPKSLEGAAITLEQQSYTETKSEIESRIISVKLGELNVTSNDYDASYDKNIEPGDQASVILKGKNNFTGTAQTTFTIVYNPDLATKIPMYRLYNKWSYEHFYTANEDERNNLIQIGWNDEQIGWYAPGDDKSIPVYRLYNQWTTDHHYTMSKDEYNACVAAGWTGEEIGWYSDPNQAVPLYREYNPWMLMAGSHNYTTSQEEHKRLLDLGWLDEDIAWYGVPWPEETEAQ